MFRTVWSGEREGEEREEMEKKDEEIVHMYGCTEAGAPTLGALPWFGTFKNPTPEHR